MDRDTSVPELHLIRETDSSLVPALCRKGYYVLALFDEPANAGRNPFGRRHYDYGEAALVVRSATSAPDELPRHCRWIAAFTAALLAPGYERSGGVLRRFSYRTAEALHLSAEELRTLTGCFDDLQRETDREDDRYCKCILTRHIDRMLEYIDRFYERQFITREMENRRLLADYRNLLDRYLAEGRVPLFGPPAAALCADRLHLSESYFADLLLFETGHTHEHIFQTARLDMARRMLQETQKSVGQIAAELGYGSVFRFSLLFRKLAGCTPDAYRRRP